MSGAVFGFITGAGVLAIVQLVLEWRSTHRKRRKVHQKDYYKICDGCTLPRQ